MRGGKSTDFCEECSVLTSDEFIQWVRARGLGHVYYGLRKFYSGVFVNLDLPLARRAAEEAASAAESVISEFQQQGNWSVTLKQDTSPVTEVDVASERCIKEILTKALPQAAFFGEETGRAEGVGASNCRWLVDPIDGTKSFIRGMRYFSTQIALEVENELILGVSNAQGYGERLVCVKGEGVWLNGKPVRCSAVTDVTDAFLSSGNLTTLASDTRSWQGYGDIVRQARRVRGYGDFCHYHQLCSGQTDLIIESDVNILDIAALTVGVREAGGIITDLEGKAIDEHTTSVLAACTETLHAQALSMLADFAHRNDGGS